MADIGFRSPVDSLISNFKNDISSGYAGNGWWRNFSRDFSDGTGIYNVHYGYDLNWTKNGGVNDDVGAPVYATYAGTVVRSQGGLSWNKGGNTGYGNVIAIKHDMSRFYDWDDYLDENGDQRFVYSEYEHMYDFDTNTNTVDYRAYSEDFFENILTEKTNEDGDTYTVGPEDLAGENHSISVDDTIGAFFGTRYGHSQQIGNIASSGASDGAHLHFQMWVGGKNDTKKDFNEGEEEGSIDAFVFIREHSFSDYESLAYRDLLPAFYGVVPPENEPTKLAHTLDIDNTTDNRNGSLNYYGRLYNDEDVDNYTISLDAGNYYFTLVEESLFRYENAAKGLQYGFSNLDIFYLDSFRSNHTQIAFFKLDERTDVNFSIGSTIDPSFFSTEDYRFSFRESPFQLENITLPNENTQNHPPALEFGGGGNQTPIIPSLPSQPPASGDVYVRSINREEHFSVGEEDSFSAGIGSGNSWVYRLTTLYAGDLDVSATLWGGAGATVSLARDNNRDGYIQSGEIIQQISLASVSSGTLGISESLSGSAERYLIVTSTGNGGASSEIRISAKLNDPGTGNGTPAVSNPPLPLPQDESSQSSPSSISDDGYSRFARIGISGDLDYFRTNLLEGGRSYSFTAMPSGSQALSDLRMFIYDSAGNYVSSASATPGNVAHFNVDIPTGNSQPYYTIEILGANGATGGYAISYLDTGAIVPPDDHPDGSFTPIAIGGTDTAYIGSADDVDNFSFTTAYGHQYTVTITPVAGTLAPLTYGRIAVSDTDGDMVVTRSVESASTFAVQFVAYEAGDFKLALDALRQATGQANISITDNGQVVYPAPTVAGATFEGNLTSQSSWTPISWSYDNFTPNGDVYDLFVSMGSEATIYVKENGNEYGGVDVQVFTQGGEIITPEYHGNYPGDGHEYTFSSSPDLGVFYKVLVSYSGNGNNTDFSYGIASVQTDDKPEIPNEIFTLDVNGIATGQIENYDNGDVFQYTGPRGSVRFVVTEGDVAPGSSFPTIHDASIRIFDDEGNVYGVEYIDNFAVEDMRVYIPEGPSHIYFEIGERSSEGYYQLSAFTVTDDFAGESSTTGELLIGGTVSGQLETYGDVDAFSARFVGGASYEINRPNITNAAHGTYLAIIDPETGEEIIRTGSSTLNFQTPLTGNDSYMDVLVVIGHNRSVVPNETSDYTGAYILELNDTTPDDHGNDVAGSTAIALGETVNAFAEKINDIDAFTVSDLTIGDVYQINLGVDESATLQMVSTAVDILDIDGIPISTVASDDNGNLVYNFVAQETSQTFLIRPFGGQRLGGVEFSVDAVNIAPTLVTGSAIVSTGESVDLSVLMAFSDENGDSISQVEFKNLSPNLGKLVGPDNLPVDELSVTTNEHVSFLADQENDEALIVVRVYDGTDWSDWCALPVSVIRDDIVDLQGDDQPNSIFGTSGADNIFGYQGNDSLYGGAGNDILDGGSGINNIYGGPGSDTFNFSFMDTTTIISDFETGVDSFDFSGVRSQAEAVFVVMGDEAYGLTNEISSEYQYTNLTLDVDQNGSDMEVTTYYSNTSVSEESLITFQDVSMSNFDFHDF